jgi:hypothetical protein
VRGRASAARLAPRLAQWLAVLVVGAAGGAAYRNYKKSEVGMRSILPLCFSLQRGGARILVSLLPRVREVVRKTFASERSLPLAGWSCC